MAFSTVTLSTRFGSKFAKETSATSTKVVVATVASTLYSVEINNTANTSVNSFVKLYDKATGSVTIGTTAPEVILKAPAATTVTYQFDLGVAFGTGIVMAALNSAGTAGTTSPGSAVIVKLVYD
jgi:hypothetical protein